MATTLTSQHPLAVTCPAMFIAAPASGQGKTTVTAALARRYRQNGLHVRVFKTGPDFLDPLILEQASGSPVYQLDLFMGGEEHCRDLLYRAASVADVILVEGVMGLFDGEPSGADLAQCFGLPVLSVINAAAMAQTFAAVAWGMAHFRDGLWFTGVLANQVGSDSHAQLLQESLPPGMTWYGALHKDAGMTLPSRHLGLLPAAEIADIDERLERAAQQLAATTGLTLPPTVNFTPAAPCESITPILHGTTIAVARDAAFAFLYHANLDTLLNLGAELVFFSPLAGDGLPPCDSVYLPGGYPELHLQSLTSNNAFHASLREHHRAGKPIVAECGGMMVLFDMITGKNGECAPMSGLLSGHVTLGERLANLGLHSVSLPEGCLNGHTFHHSTTETSMVPLTHTTGRRGKPEAIYRDGRLHASYLHLYFPSSPEATARLFRPSDTSAACKSTRPPGDGEIHGWSMNR